MQPTSKTSKLEIPIPPPKETSQESIKLSGYLYKTGSNRRGNSCPYFVMNVLFIVQKDELINGYQVIRQVL